MTCKRHGKSLGRTDGFWENITEDNSAVMDYESENSFQEVSYTYMKNLFL